jgi:hypothetical protein
MESSMNHLDELQRRGAMTWLVEEQAWVADPEQVVRALADGGFQEYRREVARRHRTRGAGGGMWQGQDPRTGVVATVIWVACATPPETHVFVEIDGRPVEGSAWAEIDDAVLNALAEAGGRLTPLEIAWRVGMSEEAVRSVLAMLAEQHRVRIAAVELPDPAAAERRVARAASPASDRRPAADPQAGA